VQSPAGPDFSNLVNFFIKQKLHALHALVRSVMHPAADRKRFPLFPKTGFRVFACIENAQQMITTMI
jgi:hypothetical protein